MKIAMTCTAVSTVQGMPWPMLKVELSGAPYTSLSIGIAQPTPEQYAACVVGSTYEVELPWLLENREDPTQWPTR